MLGKKVYEEINKWSLKK